MSDDSKTDRGWLKGDFAVREVLGHFSRIPVAVIALLAGLDMEGICASSGSACSAGSLEPSHVIRALGWGNALANALVRFSLGRENTAADISLVADCLETVIRRSQLGQ